MRSERGRALQRLVLILSRRASDWFEQNGLIGEVVSHAPAANAVERVAALVENHTLLAIFHGRLAAEAKHG